MKVNESIKTIFYLPPYESLLKQGNFKTDQAQFLKLCLLKRIILLKKQHQGTFLHSYICNENVNTNDFYVTQDASLSH